MGEMAKSLEQIVSNEVHLKIVETGGLSIEPNAENWLLARNWSASYVHRATKV